MPKVRMARIVGDRQKQDQFRFVRVNQSVGKNPQRPFTHAEGMGVTQQRIAPDKVLGSRECRLEPFAQPLCMELIPIERLNNIKPRAGMILDGL